MLLVGGAALADDSSWHVPASPPGDLFAKAGSKAQAAERPRGIVQSLQFSAGSDLPFRGTSLTSGHGYLSAGYGASYTPNQATFIGGGAFLSSKYDHGEMERPVYGYWGTATGDTRFGLLTMNAFYFDISNDDDMLSVEFGDEIHRDVAKGVTLHASFAAAPKMLSTFGDMLYLQSGVKIEPTRWMLGWGLKAHAGYQWIEDNEGFGTPDYADYEVTLTRAWRGIDISVSGVSSNITRKDCFDGTKDCDARLLLTLAHAVAF